MKKINECGDTGCGSTSSRDNLTVNSTYDSQNDEKSVTITARNGMADDLMDILKLSGVVPGAEQAAPPAEVAPVAQIAPVPEPASAVVVGESDGHWWGGNPHGVEEPHVEDFDDDYTQHEDYYHECENCGAIHGADECVVPSDDEVPVERVDDEGYEHIDMPESKVTEGLGDWFSRLKGKIGGNEGAAYDNGAFDEHGVFYALKDKIAEISLSKEPHLSKNSIERLAYMTVNQNPEVASLDVLVQDVMPKIEAHRKAIEAGRNPDGPAYLATFLKPDSTTTTRGLHIKAHGASDDTAALAAATKMAAENGYKLLRVNNQGTLKDIFVAKKSLGEGLTPKRENSGLNGAPKTWQNEPNEQMAGWRTMVDDSQGLSKPQDMFNNAKGNDNNMTIAKNKGEGQIHDKYKRISVADKLQEFSATDDKNVKALAEKLQSKFNVTESFNRVRVGSLYTYVPVMLDQIDGKTHLQKGDIVRVINVHGAPKANVMGHCYVGDPNNENRFIGMVHCNSLVPLKKGGKGGVNESDSPNSPVNEDFCISCDKRIPKDSDVDQCKACQKKEDAKKKKVSESAPPDQERWVRKNKKKFKKEYGDKKGEEVLYATAWKRHNEGITNDDEALNEDNGIESAKGGKNATGDNIGKDVEKEAHSRGGVDHKSHNKGEPFTPDNEKNDRGPTNKVAMTNESPDGLFGYVCFYNGKRIEVYAPNTFAAQKKVAAQLNVPPKKQYMIAVKLAERPDGSEVSHIATEAKEEGFPPVECCKCGHVGRAFNCRGCKHKICTSCHDAPPKKKPAKKVTKESKLGDLAWQGKNPKKFWTKITYNLDKIIFKLFWGETFPKDRPHYDTATITKYLKDYGLSDEQIKNIRLCAIAAMKSAMQNAGVPADRIYKENSSFSVYNFYPYAWEHMGRDEEVKKRDEIDTAARHKFELLLKKYGHKLTESKDKNTCPACGKETTKKLCPSCGHKTYVHPKRRDDAVNESVSKSKEKKLREILASLEKRVAKLSAPPSVKTRISQSLERFEEKLEAFKDALDAKDGKGEEKEEKPATSKKETKEDDEPKSDGKSKGGNFEKKSDKGESKKEDSDSKKSDESDESDSEDTKKDTPKDNTPKGKSIKGIGKGIYEALTEWRDENNPVTNAIMGRFERAYDGVLEKYGYDVVEELANDLGSRIGKVDEIGSSDVSAWVRQIMDELGA